MNYDLNWWAIVVSVISMNVLGMLWYGPFFGKQWMALSGIAPDSIDKSKGMKAMLIGLIPSIIMVYVLAHIVYTYETVAHLGRQIFDPLPGGLQAGFWVWIGFIATVLLNSVLYERKPFKLYLINISYYLVTLLVAGVILAVWR